MEKIIGILPAGGQAKRIHGFFKEMMPIGVNEFDRTKFVISSGQLISDMIECKASSIHFITTSDKSFIEEYYAQQEPVLNQKISFGRIDKALENKGMPYTINYRYDHFKDYDYVFMGMPDTVIEPGNAFSIILNLLRAKEADFALGLFDIGAFNKGGFIKYDKQTNKVLQHIDKTQGLPAGADNAWGIACWNRKFSAYIHDLIEGGVFEKLKREIIFGDVIDQAITNDKIQVVADFIKGGFYWDIGEPEKYFELLNHRSPTPNSSEVKKPKGHKIFIGHGRETTWEQLRDFIRKLGLHFEEFNSSPVVGKTTQEVITDLLKNSAFAFLVMTGELLDNNGKLHARDNVIHEIGLFQAHLGFEKVAILLEDGCEEFSNISGITQIRFPKGFLMAKSEEIRDVLQRESII